MVLPPIAQARALDGFNTDGLGRNSGIPALVTSAGLLIFSHGQIIALKQKALLI